MNSNPKYKLLTGNALKIIALITMLIDHIGAVLLEAGLLPYIQNAVLSGTNTDYTLNDLHTYTAIDWTFRVIGRIAFPIFLFLLVEGFMHTRDPFKYAFRLFIFALISEVPFDLAVNHRILEIGYQNIYFTLTLSVLMYIALELTDENVAKYWLNMLLKVVIVVLALLGAEVLRCDYSSLGVAMALFMYVFRYDKKKLILSLAVIIFVNGLLESLYSGFSPFKFVELFALLAFIPIALYNGERGSFRLKYFFYIFYPAHLLILAGIRYLILK